jgi:hypothetical protein
MCRQADMEDEPQKKVSPIWHSDIPGMLAFWFAPLIIGILAAMILPLLNRIQRADAWSVFGVALAIAVVGVILLFCARLPLYRQGRFYSFGSRLLDAPHRRLYRAA